MYELWLRGYEKYDTQYCRFIISQKGESDLCSCTDHQSGDASSFPETMVSSILRESTTRANCSKCKQFAPLDTRRTLARGTLPPVISLNALVASQETFEIWKDKRTARYLPSSIKLQANSDGSIDVGSGDEYNVQVSPNHIGRH
jgi:hypothetical protein